MGPIGNMAVRIYDVGRGGGVGWGGGPKNEVALHAIRTSVRRSGEEYLYLLAPRRHMIWGKPVPELQERGWGNWRESPKRIVGYERVSFGGRSRWNSLQGMSRVHCGSVPFVRKGYG